MTTDQGPPDDQLASSVLMGGEEERIRQRVLRNPGVRALLVSRFASVLGITTLSYGAMIHLAAVGAPQIAISALGATSYVAALAFGIGGGALSEAMSKRRAMITAYTLQSAACFVLPTIWGPSVPALLVLIFLIAALGQVVTPAVKAAPRWSLRHPRMPWSPPQSRWLAGSARRSVLLFLHPS